MITTTALNLQNAKVTSACSATISHRTHAHKCNTIRISSRGVGVRPGYRRASRGTRASRYDRQRRLQSLGSLDQASSRAAHTQDHCDLTKRRNLQASRRDRQRRLQSLLDQASSRAAHTQDHCDPTKGETVELVDVTVDVSFSQWKVLTKRAAEKPTLKTTVI